jgi:hypothetical protein
MGKVKTKVRLTLGNTKGNKLFANMQADLQINFFNLIHVK